MSKREIPIFCYWNRSITKGSNGLCYDGPPLIAIKLKRKKNERVVRQDVLHIGFDTKRAQLNLICRYPTIVQSSMIKYICLPIVDDSIVDIMLEISVIHPSINNIELYLEVELLH